ncbi:Putative glycosyltransferase EpsH [Clostridiales bacterium CHKCI001]|nr:Putative glycosyltransferase EpsH [Clostridiales bacterium CHKCI001]
MGNEISIVIPVYNGAQYIERCITSILTQDYTGCQIIIVDDGSTDDTLRICREIVGQNDHFLILHQENQGVSAARNKGMTYVKKEWIYFLDADDELDQDALQIMKESIEPQCQWIVMNYRKQVDGEKELIENWIGFKGKRKFYGKDGFVDLLNSELFMYPCGKLYKTEIIKKNAVQFPLNIVYGEDIRFNLQYFCYVNEYLVQSSSAFIYHIRKGEGAGSSYYENSFQMQMDIDKEILDYMRKDYGLGKESIQKINPYFFRQGINTAAAYLTIWKKLPFLYRWREIRKIMRDSRFLSFLECEWDCGRIQKIDYLLLKKGFFLLYYGIHYVYTKWKQIRRKEETL